ncbi:hypothetical protein QVD17_10512 [Tagetes erecta]|uniref:Transmembrane protein n=1 Tax=Tagetes erecta TaxID=13708 RepID=A0AAD8L9F4_TARER|nr:hypothetical protein QVD17_10512 [Tagetes erecta]
MDSYGFFDNVELEKANALARYNRFNTISKLVRVIEVMFIVAFFISWSSTRLPMVFKVSSEYLYVCFSYLLKQHVVFLLGNAIVVVCYVLSRHTDDHIINETTGTEIIENSTFRSYSDGDKTSEVVSVIEPVTVDIKQETFIKQVPQANRADNVKVETESVIAAETVIKKATKEIEKFNRTQSVKLRREMTMKPCKDLRRSVTERRRNVVSDDGGCSTPSSPVESLSDEEFRLTVEAFILKQQRLLKEQIKHG